MEKLMHDLMAHYSIPPDAQFSISHRAQPKETGATEEWANQEFKCIAKIY